MKKIFAMVAAAFASVASFAQAPALIQYSCVVMDESKQLVANQNVTGAVCIGHDIENIKDLATLSSSAIFVELFSATTDDNGAISFVIGKGTPKLGNMNDVASALAKYPDGKMSVVVVMDPHGGSQYSVFGQSYMLSVPYALSAGYAQVAATALGTASAPSVSILPSLSVHGDAAAVTVNGTVVDGKNEVNIPLYQKFYVQLQDVGSNSYSFSCTADYGTVEMKYVDVYKDASGKSWKYYEVGPILQPTTSLSLYFNQQIY